MRNRHDQNDYNHYHHDFDPDSTQLSVKSTGANHLVTSKQRAASAAGAGAASCGLQRFSADDFQSDG